jgi:ATP-binding cassette subfamily B protein
MRDDKQKSSEDRSLPHAALHRHPLRLILGKLRRHGNLLLASIFFSAAGVVMALVDPIIVRILIDRYAQGSAPARNTEFFLGLIGMLGLAVLAAILSRLCKNRQEKLVMRVAQQAGAELYSDGIERVLAMPFSEFESANGGDLLARIARARQDVERLITTSINTLFVAALAIIIAMTYAFWVHWAIGAFMLISVLAVSGTGMHASRKIRAMHHEIVKETASLTGVATESLRNVELVKSLGLEHQEIARLRTGTFRLIATELKKLDYLHRMTFMKGAAVSFSRAIGLGLLLALIVAKELTIGEVVSLLLFAFYVFGPLQELGRVLGIYREAEASLRIYSTITDMSTLPQPATLIKPVTIPALEFDAVSFRYPRSPSDSLHRLSFRAERGRVVGLVGPSGSGKSTLVKLLTGLYAADDGCIRYGGIDSAAVDMAFIREKIGLVTQETILYSGTILENLRFSKPSASEQECLKALRDAQCIELVERSPEGLHTLIGAHGLKLSGGERQRIAIARALVRQPEILIFDEATSSLDSLTESMISRTIHRIAAERSLVGIVVAHRLATVAAADRIYVLERGEVKQQGSHESLLSEEGLYRLMWTQQTYESRTSDPAAPDTQPSIAAPFLSSGFAEVSRNEGS